MSKTMGSLRYTASVQASDGCGGTTTLLGTLSMIPQNMMIYIGPDSSTSYQFGQGITGGSNKDFVFTITTPAGNQVSGGPVHVASSVVSAPCNDRTTINTDQSFTVSP